MELQAKVKKNPVRIKIDKYGNSLMLLMECAGRYSMPILGKVTELDKEFDIELRMTAPTAQSVKNYINSNL